MVTWIRLLLVALALVAGIAEGVTADDTSAEVMESVIDDAVTETDAPLPPPLTAAIARTATDSTLPHAPPTSPIFRPPRSAS